MAIAYEKVKVTINSVANSMLILIKFKSQHLSTLDTYMIVKFNEIN